MKQITPKEKIEPSDNAPVDPQAEKKAGGRKKTWLLPLFLFVIVIALLVLAGYQGWLFFSQYKQDTVAQMEELQTQIAQRPLVSQMEAKLKPLEAKFKPLEAKLNSLNGKIDQTARQFPVLEQGQQDLTKSVEKLFTLYARDKNGWRLSEVEYLMSVAQHKLILEHDFEGAARTLNAASERIAELADPGLLPVRVQINDEIAQLKTRKRPDLAGMTLLLSRLARQIGSLQPGFQPKIEKQAATPVPPASPVPPVPPVPTVPPETPSTTEATEATETSATLATVMEKVAPAIRELDQKMTKFVTSLVTIKTSQPAKEETEVTEVTEVKVEQTIIPDVREELQEALKLTRWAVLDRDALQFSKLMEQNVNLFKQNYDLEKPQNADFFESLKELQQSPIQPELPDITTSLRLLKEIQTKRETPLPQNSKQEASNG
jgi:uroporphyrin-3 C-methyltransferase